MRGTFPYLKQMPPRRRYIRRRPKRYGRRRVRRAPMRLMRRVLTNPTPTFVETLHKGTDDFSITPNGSVSRVFTVKINDIGQWQQYFQLYTQYRINWVKVFVMPSFNGQSADPNAAAANVQAPANVYGMTRVAYAIQDSPGVTAPASEDTVLQMNGVKIKNMGSMWHCSFKPAAYTTVGNTAGGTTLTRPRYRQWFNFDDQNTNNNPTHGAVVAYFTIPGINIPIDETALQFRVYYKINFSLRDPR